MSIIISLLIINIIIVIHEGGHCLIAKKSGIAVKEFFVGVGPDIISIEKGGTKYALKLIPFGGACVFDGMFEESDNPSAYLNSPVWRRIATVLAGPFMNFFLSFFLALFVIGIVGIDKPVIAEVMPGYPASEAGISAGDEIVKLDNKRIEIYRDISLEGMFSTGKSVRVTYKHDGLLKETVLTPRYSKEDGRYLFGFRGPKEYVKGNPLEVVKYSIVETRYWIEATVKSLGLIFKGKVTKDDFAGPVGVTKVVGDVYEASKPSGIFYIFLNLMNLTILLSADIGVMNLLPLPALDGGKFLFLLFEAVTGKKPSPRFEGVVQFAGMCLLLVFVIFITFNDITRFFR
ncbi:MAG: RIP metalloprotease [Lachnospiraceae bacterium]|nr:RIP metalloprotease [Lachnospiraceae bacterium]